MLNRAVYLGGLSHAFISIYYLNILRHFDYLCLYIIHSCIRHGEYNTEEEEETLVVKLEKPKQGNQDIKRVISLDKFSKCVLKSEK